MKSYLSDDFLECFRKIPTNIQNQAKKSYQLWQQNPNHPSLRFKRVHTGEAIYSIRIGQGWRALGLREGNSIYWFWIGSHADYDKLLFQL